MKNLVIPDFKEGSDKKTLGQILNIPQIIHPLNIYQMPVMEQTLL